MSERIGLTVEPTDLQVQVGGEAAQAAITVENRSTIVDQYDVTLEGLEQGWYDLSGGVAGVFPGEKAQVNVVFHPPQTIEAKAGTIPFVIRASSRSNPAEYSSVEGTLEVLESGAASLEMTPERLEGRQGVTHLVFRNQRNAPVDLTLRATDMEEGLEYRFAPGTVTLPAAGEEDIELKIQPKKRPRFGAVHEYQFRVEALEEGAEEALLAADGSFAYQPPLASLPVALRSLWRKAKPILPLLLSLAALGLALAGMLKPPETAKPSDPSSLPPSIQSFRSEASPDGTLQLKWQVEGAEKVKLDGSDVDPKQGSKTITNLENKEYSLEATNQSGTVRQRLGIVVVKPPTIVSFEAQPSTVAPGESVTLAWKVQNATKANVDGTSVDQKDVASGKLQVKPEQSRDYVLMAENDVGWVVRRVTVQVK